MERTTGFEPATLTLARRRIVIVCNEGYQSSLAAALLHDVGLHRATDLVGGFQAWLTFTAAMGVDRR